MSHIHCHVYPADFESWNVTTHLIIYRMGIETGSLIISSQVAVQRGDDVLTTPVTIAFDDIIVENFTEPECVFWDFSVP